MPTVKTMRVIHAPVEIVFRAVADIREFAEIQPHIINVRFLTQQQVGRGTRFRETRLMGGRKAVTELIVTEYEENKFIRLIADSGGTIWDTMFSVQIHADGTTGLDMVMEARAHRFFAKLMNPLIMRIVKKAIDADMDRVKAHCEGAR